MLEVSEHQLYLYAQAGVTLYSDLLATVVKWNIREHVPEQVLPVCTATPKDIQVVQIGGVTFKRYSMKALDELQKAFKTVDMDKVWLLNKPTGKPSAPSLGSSS